MCIVTIFTIFLPCSSGWSVDVAISVIAFSRFCMLLFWTHCESAHSGAPQSLLSFFLVRLGLERVSPCVPSLPWPVALVAVSSTFISSLPLTFPVFCRGCGMHGVPALLYWAYCSPLRRTRSLPSFVSASNTSFLSSILSWCMTSCKAVSNPCA